MANVNEVYRLGDEHSESPDWVDVDVTAVSGADNNTITYTVSEVGGGSAATIGDVVTVDLATVTAELLYDKDGKTTGEEAEDTE
jgi:hypothetical protein